MIVTYCSRTKTDRSHGTPEQLYTSQRIRSFFNRFRKREKAILSYKYGLILEKEVIDNYEQSAFGENYSDCVKKVSDCLKSRKIYFYSPRPLVETPWIDLLQDAGIDYEVIRSYKELQKPRRKQMLLLTDEEADAQRLMKIIQRPGSHSSEEIIQAHKELRKLTKKTTKTE